MAYTGPVWSIGEPGGTCRERRGSYFSAWRVQFGSATGKEADEKEALFGSDRYGIPAIAYFITIFFLLVDLNHHPVLAYEDSCMVVYMIQVQYR